MDRIITIFLFILAVELGCCLLWNMYCKVAISNTSGLKAHAGLFRLLTYSRLRNRLRAGNKRRAWKIWQKFEVFVMKKLEKIIFSDF